MDECEQIDNSKDVFGRTRFANHREVMKWIGCFTSDTRAIFIIHYKMPKAETSTQTLGLMYDTLWRHFSPLGDLDDLKVIPAKGVSFIRYKHRCQAEFAKEAMDSQALDQKVQCVNGLMRIHIQRLCLENLKRRSLNYLMLLKIKRKKNNKIIRNLGRKLMVNRLEIDHRIIEKAKEVGIEEIEEEDLMNEEEIIEVGVEIDYLMMIDNLHHFILHNYFIIWEVRNVVTKLFRMRITRTKVAIKQKIRIMLILERNLIYRAY